MPRRFDVKALRDVMGISQTDLADRLGVHQRTIQRWENAEVDPSPLAVRRLRELHDEHRQRAERNDQTSTNNVLTRAARGLAGLPSLS